MTLSSFGDPGAADSRIQMLQSVCFSGQALWTSGPLPESPWVSESHVFQESGFKEQGSGWVSSESFLPGQKESATPGLLGFLKCFF